MSTFTAVHATDVLRRQLGAAIQMLDNAIRACPQHLWSTSDQPRAAEFWYVAYHTTFFLDYYLSPAPEGFAAPAPFTLSELDPAGVRPERVYTPQELQAYLNHCREKLKVVLDRSADDTLQESRVFPSIAGTHLELLIYNMRHVQHHAAQLNLLLRQQTAHAPAWVSVGNC